LNDHSVLKRDESKNEEEVGWGESFEGEPRSTLVGGRERRRNAVVQQ